MIEYKTVSLANQVFERIEYSILSGEYAIGEVISEKRLAAELGVSRTPIREALSRLAAEGLIEDSPNGTVVVGITDKDVDDFYELKRRIEGLAFRWATELIDEEGMTALKELVEQQEFYAQKCDAAKIRDLDTELHSTVYQYCGSNVFREILTTMHRKMLRYRQASLEANKARIPASIAEHRAILEAMGDRDADKVEELLLIHVEHAYQGILKEREMRNNK